jgi:hypothetical protein
MGAVVDFKLMEQFLAIVDSRVTSDDQSIAGSERKHFIQRLGRSPKRAVTQAN